MTLRRAKPIEVLLDVLPQLHQELLDVFLASDTEVLLASLRLPLAVRPNERPRDNLRKREDHSLLELVVEVCFESIDEALHLVLLSDVLPEEQAKALDELVFSSCSAAVPCGPGDLEIDEVPTLPVVMEESNQVMFEESLLELHALKHLVLQSEWLVVYLARPRRPALKVEDAQQTLSPHFLRVGPNDEREARQVFFVCLALVDSVVSDVDH